MEASDDQGWLGWYDPHDLRHTAVSLWIATGDNPKAISVRAGHTSVSFTGDRYGHLFPDSDSELRSRLEALFEAGREQSTAEVIPLRAL